MRALAALTLLLLFGLAACSKGSQVASGDMTMGRAAAPITLIEYGSVTCAHCAAFQENILPELQSKYIATGKVRYVFREYLTPPENIAAAGFLTARCAGKDRYFQVIDAIMRAQPDMYAGDDTHNAMPTLRRIGKSFGLSDSAFDRCVTDLKGTQAIQAKMAEYDRADPITGAPTFYVNGRRLVRTTGDIRDFDTAFAPLLANH